jgi:cytochrome b
MKFKCFIPVLVLSSWPARDETKFHEVTFSSSHHTQGCHESTREVLKKVHQYQFHNFYVLITIVQ